MFEDAELMRAIDDEFDCYRHHQRRRNGVPNHGWLRVMHHSYVQQAVRQSPEYWMLYVLLRPDYAYRLVSMPYFAKFSQPGDSTKFRHIDVNIDNLLTQGLGANMIQGSLSFDRETPEDCTELLVGMHRRLGDWWADVKEHLAATDQDVRQGYIHLLEGQHWTPAMAAKFATDDIRWEAHPCDRGEVRVSLPHLPHGALGPTTKSRRTILPWFVRVRHEHELPAADGQEPDYALEMPDAGTYRDVASAHRRLQTNERTPSGLRLERTRVPYRFPAAGHLAGLGPISDALMGRLTWDDPQVVADLGRYFAAGATSEARSGYIDAWRRAAKQQMMAGYQRFRIAEMASYGDASFFRRWEENRLYIPLPDDLDPGEVPPSPAGGVARSIAADAQMGAGGLA